MPHEIGPCDHGIPSGEECDDCNLVMLRKCPSCALHLATIARLTEEVDALKWSIEDCVSHYPVDIFPDPNKEDFSHLHQRRGASERLHGSWARHLIKVIRDNAELRRASGE